jgi:hypothetical protein
MSKYEIKETRKNYRELFRYDENRGLPNNAELQFWMEREEAREQRDKLKAALEKIIQVDGNEGCIHGPSIAKQALIELES